MGRQWRPLTSWRRWHGCGAARVWASCRLAGSRLLAAGASWRRRCSLHDEHTPGFAVTLERAPATGRRYFGACDTGGDVIGLVQGLDDVPFRDAVCRLVSRSAITLDDD